MSVGSREEGVASESVRSSEEGVASESLRSSEEGMASECFSMWLLYVATQVFNLASISLNIYHFDRLFSALVCCFRQLGVRQLFVAM